MRNTLKVLVILAVLALPALALAAGSTSITAQGYGEYTAETFTFTGDATTGAFVVNTTSQAARGTFPPSGYVYQVEYAPVAGSPVTNSLGLIINTSDGIDILGGNGTGLSNATGGTIVPEVDTASGTRGGYLTTSPLTLYLTGNSIASGKYMIKLLIWTGE